MRYLSQWVWVVLLIGLVGLFYCQSERNEPSNLGFALYFPEELCSESLDGRMILLISSDGSQEPRFQISNGPDLISPG